MPPKKQKKNKSEESQQKTTRHTHTRIPKRKVSSEEETSEAEYLQYLAKYFDEQSKKKKGQSSKQKMGSEQNSSSTFEPSEVDQFCLGDEGECAICLQRNIQSEKYILSCRHILCNECFLYWSNIESECPLCYKKCTSVRMVFSRASRQTTTSPKLIEEVCQFCLSSNNPEQLYFCDHCEVGCTHLYCRPELLLYPERTFWLCTNCKDQQRRNSQDHNKANPLGSQAPSFHQELTELETIVSNSHSKIVSSPTNEVGQERKRRKNKPKTKNSQQDLIGSTSDRN